MIVLPLCAVLSLAQSTADGDRAAAALLSLSVDGPLGPDQRPLFPADLRVVDVDGRPALGPDGAVVVVAGSFFRGDAGDEVRDELLRETLMGAFDAAGVEGGVDVVDDATGLPLGAHLHDDPRPTGRVIVRGPRDKKTTAALPFGGALLGRRIGPSAGHGWLDDDGDGSYGTQRSNFQFSQSARGITEDFFTAELMSNQLIPLLLNMGADLVIVRASDHDPAPERVVDAGLAQVQEGAFSLQTGGVGGSFLQATQEGSGLVVLSMSTSARAVRRVAVRFADVVDGAAVVVVSVVHAGGVRTFDLDQRRGGGSWQDLGAFALDADSAVEFAAGPGTGRLVVDAVQVGGGTHGSDKPWWQMAAKTYVPERASPDVPSSVTAKGDVTIRPSYAEVYDVDAFISIHANASGSGAGSTANGMSVYRYSCQTFSDHSSSTSATSCDDPPGSRDLLDEIHQSTLQELNGAWDPEFNDRGRLVANFGELRDLIDAPGVLVETAFFDNLANPSGSPPPRMSDNRALHDPRFREAFATGLVRGLARFFDATAAAPPTRPNALLARNVDDAVVVSWSAVPAATGYKVRTATVSDDGVRAFDEGVVVTGTSAAFSDLAPGSIVAFSVAALNENGEGFSSSAVAAKVGPPVGLIVDAYDRRDAFVQEIDNTLDYAFEHAAALGTALPGFDGADDDALAELALGDWDFVDVLCGKDSTEHEPVSKALQGRLAAYVQGGGRLFLSGEEVGYALIETSDDAEDEAFFSDVLGAVYVADDADTFDVTLDGVSAQLDDGSGGVYEVIYPDVIAAADGATVIGTWPDGTGAAVHKGSVIFLATPFEALVPSSTRATVMQSIVARLQVPVPAGEGEGEGEGEANEGEGEANEGEGEPAEGEGEGGITAQTNRVIVQSVPGGCGCASSSSSSSSSSALFWFGVLLWRRAARRSRPR